MNRPLERNQGRACKDCKHLWTCEGSWGCAHPIIEPHTKVFDRIVGWKDEFKLVYCDQARAEGSPCGPEGKLFEESRSLFRAIRILIEKYT